MCLFNYNAKFFLGDGGYAPSHRFITPVTDRQTHQEVLLS